MKEVKELEFDKEVLKRIEMICRFACVKPIITKGSIINIKGIVIHPYPAKKATLDWVQKNKKAFRKF